MLLSARASTNSKTYHIQFCFISMKVRYAVVELQTGYYDRRPVLWIKTRTKIIAGNSCFDVGRCLLYWALYSNLQWAALWSYLSPRKLINWNWYGYICSENPFLNRDVWWRGGHGQFLGKSFKLWWTRTTSLLKDNDSWRILYIKQISKIWSLNLS